MRPTGRFFPPAPGVHSAVLSTRENIGSSIFPVQQVVSHLERFFSHVLSVNPKLRVVLTVSPCALATTLKGGTYCQSTVYSKSVLRVACEELIRNVQVHYFAAYEIVTAYFRRRGRIHERPKVGDTRRRRSCRSLFPAPVHRPL